MIRILFIIISVFLLSTTVANSKYGTQLMEKDYLSIFTKYKVNNNIARNIINKCVEKFGRENLKMTKNNKGENVINHNNMEGFLNCTNENILKNIKPVIGINQLNKKKLEEFILNNELIFDDGKGNGKVTYVFNVNDYKIFKDGKQIGQDGWRFSKTQQLRVFMDGKKTTWRISKNKLALSVKKGSNKAIPYFLESENKKVANERRLQLKKKRLAEEKRKEQERLAEEKRKEQERLAEEKRKEQERLAEEKRKEQERLAEEKRQKEERLAEEKLQKKLALIETSELEENQNFINNVKSFVEKNPGVFDVVELAKKLIKVESILDGSLNDQNRADIQELKKFVSKSSKFTEFYNDVIESEKISKLNLIDNELLRLEKRLQKSKEYLISNLGSPFSKQIIEIIEKAENQLNSINNLDEIRFLIKEIDELSLIITEYETSVLSLNEYQVKLKKYLTKYISTEISQSIINKIELIDKNLIEKNPENIENLNIDIGRFINDTIKKYEEKIDQEKKVKAEEKRKEEERLAEEKRKEEKRLAEEKRKEEKRLAEEKRKEEERLAEEKRKVEEEKLKNIFKKYKAKSQFQKDFVRVMTKIPGIDIKKIKFSRGDKLIEADISIKKDNEFINFQNISIKSFNKNVFNKLHKSFEANKFDFSIFEEKKWFDEINAEKFSFNIDGIDFASAIIIKSFEFSKFIKNRNLIENIGKKFNLQNDEINGLGALLSFSVENLTLKDLSFSEKNGRYVSSEYFDIEDFTILDWGRWTVKNYLDKDPTLNLVTKYDYSDLKDVIFDKEEIIKIANNGDFGVLLGTSDNFGFLFNMIKSLGSGVTKNVTVRNLKTNSFIGGADSINLKSLKFDYIDSEKKQKSLTEMDFSFDGIDLNIANILPEFSTYFTLMGYESVKFDFGTNLKWKPSNNLLNFNLNLGITDAADLSLKSSFTGLSGELFNTNNVAALGAYFLSSFKLKDFKLSLTDDSLRDKLIKLSAANLKMNTNDFKMYMIGQIDNFTSAAGGNVLFDQYKKSVKKFINGSKKIELNISPSSPISIAEVSPYFLNMNVNPDQFIKILNLSITN